MTGAAQGAIGSRCRTTFRFRARASWASGTVEEDDLSNAQSAGNNEDGSVGKAVATGSLSSLVSVGADEPGTFGLSNNFAGLTGQGLTSHGTALTYSVLGDTLTAKAGALTVFTLQITNPATGAYTFTLLDQLDHGLGTNDNDEALIAINLSSVLVATDADGDFVPLTGGFIISVENDIPVATAATEAQTVFEDLLAGGNPSVGTIRPAPRRL